MSAKRYLLIPILLAWGLLSASTSIFHTSQVSGSDDETELRNRLRIDHSFGIGGTLTVDNDLVWSDRSSPSRPDKFYNSIRLSYLHRGSFWQAGGGYRSTIYDGGESQALYPLWQPLTVYDKEMQHTGYLKAGLSVQRFQVTAYHLSKALSLTPYEFDWLDFSFARQPSELLTDHFRGLSLEYQVSGSFGVFAGVSHKNGLYEDTGMFELTSTDLGAYFDWSNPPSALNLDASLRWQFREGEAIPAERKNLLISDIRLQHQLSEQVSGYIQFINRSCTDPELSELLLISNYLRGSLRYTLPFEPYGESHITAGTVYSPENDANAVFADARSRVISRLYLGLTVHHRSRDNYSYTGRIGWHWLGNNDLHLFYSYRAIGLDNRWSDFVGAGLSLYY